MAPNRKKPSPKRAPRTLTPKPKKPRKPRPSRAKPKPPVEDNPVTLIERAKSGQKLSPDERRIVVDYLYNWIGGHTILQLARMFKVSPPLIHHDLVLLDQELLVREEKRRLGARHVIRTLDVLERSVEKLRRNIRQMEVEEHRKTDKAPSQYSSRWLETHRELRDTKRQIFEMLRAWGAIEGTPEESLDRLRQEALARGLDPETVVATYHQIVDDWKRTKGDGQ